MCIVFVGVRAHPRFPVIVAANRDECVQPPLAASASVHIVSLAHCCCRCCWRCPTRRFVTRETERVHRWAHLPSVVAGRDGVAGGTWMGINPEDGRWASLVSHG